MKKQMKSLRFVFTEDVQKSILSLTEGRGSICLAIDSFKPAAYTSASMTPDSEQLRSWEAD